VLALLGDGVASPKTFDVKASVRPFSNDLKGKKRPRATTGMGNAYTPAPDAKCERIRKSECDALGKRAGTLHLARP
jgi:hypothetical protein